MKNMTSQIKLHERKLKKKIVTPKITGKKSLRQSRTRKQGNKKRNINSISVETIGPLALILFFSLAFHV